MCSFQAWWHYYHKRWVYQLIIPLRQAGMELSVLLAGQPRRCVSDLWLNQPKNTAQFWLLLSSPCTTSRFFSLFPHSALTASRGGQEAGRAQSLDRGLGHPDYKIQATNLTLSDAPVPCTRQTQTRGKCSCQTRALHLCHTFRPTGLGGQTELYTFPPTHRCCCQHGKGRISPGEQFLGGCPLKNSDRVTTAVTKGMKRKTAASSLSGQFSTLVTVSLSRKV